jgi:hypothetical protein
MIIFGKTPKDWKRDLGVKSLYYIAEIICFVVGFVIGAIVL